VSYLHVQGFRIAESGRVTRNCINSYNCAWCELTIMPHPGNGAEALFDKVTVLPSSPEKSTITSARSAGASNSFCNATGPGKKPPSVPIW